MLAYVIGCMHDAQTCLLMLGMLLMLGSRVRMCHCLVTYLRTATAAECSALLSCLANDIKQMHSHEPQLA